jgi:FkbH-like protein
MKKLSTILISDFNISNFQAYLKVDESLPQMDVCSVPFGQVIQCLVDKNHEVWNIQYDIAIIWTQPEAIINSYFNLLMYEEFDESLLINEVDKFVSLIEGLSDRVSTVFIPLWTKAVYLRGSGILSYKSRFGIDYVILKINERLSYKLSKSNNIHILDSQSWMQMAGKKAFNPKLWYMGKVPFSNEVFIEAVKDVKAAASAIYGISKKLIIVDLDDTMWGGVVGDIGWKNLVLGGHSSSGEAYIDFQKGLKSLSNRGIILCIVSKNDERVALEAIDSHPEMILRKSDFSAYRINWKDKASNIVEIVNELNIGLQSVVFIDDNPFERALVREALPEVLVPEWPNNPILYRSSLLSMDCFDVVSISKEDVNRLKMYEIEERRNSLMQEMVSVEDWINSLGMNITIECVNDSNIIRVTQLFNKTNQMNLTTRRMSESELMSWSQQHNQHIYCLKVEDKFGDYGLTGIIGLAIVDSELLITDFILSCRVMGRKVEEAMVHFIVRQAKLLGASLITAKYFSTEKNRPCLDFWRKSGFVEFNSVFSYETKENYLIPEGVTLKFQVNEV